ncbi:MAG: EAL domain-containing protein [Steroidobacteraceae bacterium]
MTASRAAALHYSSSSGQLATVAPAARALAPADAILGHPSGRFAQTEFHAFSPASEGSIVAGRQLAGVAAPATFFTSRSAIWIGFLLIISSLMAVKSGIWRVFGNEVERVRVSVDPLEPAAVAAPSGGAARFSQGQVRDPLQARISSANAAFRYQPQIDLRTGQVAGVEGLLCVPGASGYRPASELSADIEKAGLGLELFECRLQEACRGQRAWLRNVGHEFAVSVPVSRRVLADAAVLPLVQRVLAQFEIAPALLELEVEEAALGACSEPLRTLTKIHEAGISIALDGFNPNHSILRLLAMLPIAKLRVDPWLLLRVADRVSEARLFAGILGAARGLGISVCATGVATADILAAVLQHGRPLAQGMAVAGWLDGQEFLERLRGSSVDTVTVRPLRLECARSANDSSFSAVAGCS